jgi:hypothetical protein
VLDVVTPGMRTAPGIEFLTDVHHDAPDLAFILELRFLPGEAVPDHLRGEEFVRHDAQISGKAGLTRKPAMGPSDPARDVRRRSHREFMPLGGGAIAVDDPSDVEVLVGLFIKVVLVRLKQHRRQADRVARAAVQTTIPRLAA